MSRFRGAWQNLNFDKVYLFGFETLVFVTSGILFSQSACNTPKRKQNLISHHMTPLKSKSSNLFQFFSYEKEG